jgi:hypothetical protein
MAEAGLSRPDPAEAWPVVWGDRSEPEPAGAGRCWARQARARSPRTSSTTTGYLPWRDRVGVRSDGTTDRRGLGGLEQGADQPALRHWQAGEWDGPNASAIMRSRHARIVAGSRGWASEEGAALGDFGAQAGHARGPPPPHHRVAVVGVPRTRRKD